MDAYAQGYRASGWYFWDETDAYVIGPYETEAVARAALAEYEP